MSTRLIVCHFKNIQYSADESLLLFETKRKRNSAIQLQTFNKMNNMKEAIRFMGKCSEIKTIEMSHHEV